MILKPNDRSTRGQTGLRSPVVVKGDHATTTTQEKVQGAIALYKEAQKLAPEIDLNPDTEAIEKDPEAVAGKLAAPFKVEEGEKLAEEGKVQEAIALYKEAQKLAPEIDLNPNTGAIDKEPKTIALELAAPAKVEEGKRLAKQGKVEEAIALMTVNC